MGKAIISISIEYFAKILRAFQEEFDIYLEKEYDI